MFSVHGGASALFDSDMQLQLRAVLVVIGVVLYIVVLELIVSLLVYCYKGDRSKLSQPQAVHQQYWCLLVTC